LPHQKLSGRKKLQKGGNEQKRGKKEISFLRTEISVLKAGVLLIDKTSVKY